MATGNRQSRDWLSYMESCLSSSSVHLPLRVTSITFLKWCMTCCRLRPPPTWEAISAQLRPYRVTPSRILCCSSSVKAPRPCVSCSDFLDLQEAGQGCPARASASGLGHRFPLHPHTRLSPSHCLQQPFGTLLATTMSGMVSDVIASSKGFTLHRPTTQDLSPASLLATTMWGTVCDVVVASSKGFTLHCPTTQDCHLVYLLQQPCKALCVKLQHTRVSYGPLLATTMKGRVCDAIASSSGFPLHLLSKQGCQLGLSPCNDHVKYKTG